jgi:hypothetical protein
VEGSELALGSTLMAWLRRPGSQCAARLDADGWSRLTLWMDLYGQYAGAFSAEQEQELIRLREEWKDLLQKPEAITR